MIPALLANKYLLLKRIASGGMAEIYLAKQMGFDGFEKLVVVKRILPEFALNPDYVRMFLDEARTAADLRHPNIVSTFEISEDKGIYFMVMEYLHGLDLRFIFRKLTSQKEEIPLHLAVGIAMEACAGLAYAHNKTDLKGRPLGIVHRDISPQNIVLTFEGETKVVDFGIAQGTHLKDEKNSGVLKGKFAYMSPEQSDRKELDHRSDQFAIGIVLYELTTMSRLFRRKNQSESLTAIGACDIEPPSSKMPAYPAALERIVMTALAKSPEDRYADCGGLRNALDGFLQSEGLSFSRAKLSSYLLENFLDQHDPKLDLALMDIDHDRLQASYLHKQTQSNSGGSLETPKSKSLTWVNWGILVLATLLIGLVVGGSLFLMTKASDDNVSEIAQVEAPVETKVDLPAQSMGAPQASASPVASKPAAKMLGRLKVVVEPWGEVFVDGRRIGLTPLSPQKITEGLHIVRVVNARLGKEKTVKVVVRANQDTLVRHEF